MNTFQLNQIFKFTIKYEFPHSFKFKEIESKAPIEPMTIGFDLQSNRKYFEFYEFESDELLTKKFLDSPTFDFKRNKYIVFSDKSDDEVIMMFKKEILEQKIEDVCHLSIQKDQIEEDIEKLEKEISELKNEISSVTESH